MDRPRIVVADDEAHILHVVEIKLKNAGFEIITAMDGQEALELVQRERPQLLITDLQMPILSGLEVAARMHNHEQTRDIPVLLLTAKGFEVDRQATAGTGIRTVMTKPFSPRDLLSQVSELIPMAVGSA